MKRILAAVISLMVFTSLLLPGGLSAQEDPLSEVCSGAAANSSVCKSDGNNDPLAGDNGIIPNVVRIFSYFVGAAAVIMLIYGGIKFITSNGDPAGISAARNTILYALVGIAIFVSSQLLVEYVISKV